MTEQAKVQQYRWVGEDMGDALAAVGLADKAISLMRDIQAYECMASTVLALVDAESVPLDGVVAVLAELQRRLKRFALCPHCGKLLSSQVAYPLTSGLAGCLDCHYQELRSEGWIAGVCRRYLMTGSPWAEIYLCENHSGRMHPLSWIGHKNQGETRCAICSSLDVKRQRSAASDVEW